VVMLLLAVLLYAGLFTASSQEFLLVWLGVCLLLAIVVALGITDIWFTSKLRRKQ
jgi:small basic protein